MDAFLARKSSTEFPLFFSFLKEEDRLMIIRAWGQPFQIGVIKMKHNLRATS